MAKTKKKNKKQHQGNALFGTAPVMEHPVAQTVTKGGLVILAAIAAGGAGAALGKHSLLAGIPVTLGFPQEEPLHHCSRSWTHAEQRISKSK